VKSRPIPVSRTAVIKSAFPRNDIKTKNIAEGAEAGPSSERSSGRSEPMRSPPRPRSEAGISRPTFSNGGMGEPSPTPFKSSLGLARLKQEQDPTKNSRRPSSASGGIGKNSLWFELKEVQRKSRPSTDCSRSRSREPP